MHWVDRAGILVPRAIGGHPALDLCNTWAGWDDRTDPRGEWLRGYPALAAWAGYAGLLETHEEAALRRRTGPTAESVVSEVRALRTQLYAALADPQDERALAAVAGHVRRAAAGLHLVGGAEPRWRVTTTRTVELPLLRAAWAAGDLLTSGRVQEVATCPGDDCGWLFLNPTGRRRWCSMTSCGNRAKVRAFAARHR